jgi:hypothetical protein
MVTFAAEVCLDGHGRLAVRLEPTADFRGTDIYKVEVIHARLVRFSTTLGKGMVQATPVLSPHAPVTNHGAVGKPIAYDMPLLLQGAVFRNGEPVRVTYLPDRTVFVRLATPPDGFQGDSVVRAKPWVRPLLEAMLKHNAAGLKLEDARDLAEGHDDTEVRAALRSLAGAGLIVESTREPEADCWGFGEPHEQEQLAWVNTVVGTG